MSITIGQLATRAGVNIQTVRYYERRGLIPRPPRTRTGYRQYPEGAVGRLRFIKRAQELGFTLEEIRDLLELRVAKPSGAACAEVEARTRAKIDLVDQKIRELTDIRAALERLAEACRARQSTGDCPILEVLEEETAGRA